MKKSLTYLYGAHHRHLASICKTIGYSQEDKTGQLTKPGQGLGLGQDLGQY